MTSKQYRCIECNNCITEEMNKICKQCNKIIDPYFDSQKGILLIDIILIKTSAYRHLIFNEFPVKYRILIIWIFVFLLSIMESFYKFFIKENNMNIINNQNDDIFNLIPTYLMSSFDTYTQADMNLCFYKDNQIYPVSKFIQYFVHSLLSLLLDVFLINSTIKIIFMKKLAKKKINSVLIIYGLVLSQIMKFSIIFLIIWGHKQIYVLALYIYLRCSMIASIRAILEKDEFLLGIFTIILCFFFKIIIKSAIISNMPSFCNFIDDVFQLSYQI